MNKKKYIIASILALIAIILNNTMFKVPYDPNHMIEFVLQKLLDAVLGFIFGWNIGGLLIKD
jgi:hypothetical protein